MKEIKFCAKDGFCPYYIQDNKQGGKYYYSLCSIPIVREKERVFPSKEALTEFVKENIIDRCKSMWFEGSYQYFDMGSYKYVRVNARNVLVRLNDFTVIAMGFESYASCLK